MSESKSRTGALSVTWVVLITILGIACFPVNPLVLSGVLEVKSYTPLFVIGWITWAFGMVLVMAPVVMFPRRGGVPKGKSFVETSRLVDTGFYAIIRHPQYTGGVYAIFVTTFLWYPHWLFAILGIAGIAAIYFSCREEDKSMLKKFGSKYRDYMVKVPGMNLVKGFLAYMQRKKKTSPD